MDKSVKAWTFIIWISVSYTLAVHQDISDTTERINNISLTNDRELQEGSNSLFPFVKPETGHLLNQTSTTSQPPDSTSLLLNDSTDFTTVVSFSSPSIGPKITSYRTKKNIPTTIISITSQPHPTTTTTTISTTTTIGTPSDKTTTTETTSVSKPKTMLLSNMQSKTTVKTTLEMTTKMTSTKAIKTDEMPSTINEKLTTNKADTTVSSSFQTYAAQKINENSSSNSTVMSPQTSKTSGMTSLSTFGSLISTKSTKSSTIFQFHTYTNDTTHGEHLSVMNSTNNFNSTDLYANTTDSGRLTHTLADNFQSPDSFWPIALALTISIPTIVVLAITIAVLYRRRIAKPRSLLSMYGQFS